jgi:outer membrane usher protein
MGWANPAGATKVMIMSKHQGIFTSLPCLSIAETRATVCFGELGVINLIYAQTTQDPRDCFASGDFGNASTSRILSASYSRQLPFDATLTLVAFAQMSNISNRGVFAGVTMALGGGIRASANIQPMPDLNTGKTKLATTGQIYKELGQEIGSYGWSATAGTNQGSALAGSGAYRRSLGTLKVSASSYDGRPAASAEFQGALAMTGFSVAAGPRVDDAFAIVRAGTPDVAVMAANQNVGKTNIFGTLLIPNLNAYSQNKIAIDPLTLPIETAFDSTNAIVTPRNRSGVLVDFGVRTSALALGFKITDPAGKVLEVGSVGYAEDTGEKFVVGYDGVVHLKSFGAVGKIHINLGDRDCSAMIVRQSVSGAAPGSAFTCG